MKTMNVYLRHKWGGAELMAVNYAQVLARKGESVFLASAGSVLHERLAQYPSIHTTLARTEVTDGLWAPSHHTIPDIANILDREKPDVVLSHGITMAKLTFKAIARSDRNCQHVVVLHSEHDTDIKSLGDAFIAVAPHIFVYGISKGVPIERIAHVRNFLMDDLHETPAFKPVGIIPRIGYLGRLSPEKGFENFIEMLAHLDRESFLYEAIVAGDGPCAKEYFALAGRSGVLPNMHVEGWIKPEVLPAYFKKIDMLVVPAAREPFGMIILEAWKHGVPVIAMNAGGPASIIKNGYTGLLAPSAESLADAVQYLSINPDLHGRIARNARRELSRYHVDAVAPGLHRVIERVQSQRPKSSLNSCI